MRFRFQVLPILALVLLLSGCSRTTPELQEISQSFSQRYPEYVLRSISAGKSDGKRKTVEIEFDAPNNRKNRGRASVVYDKQEDGSWQVVWEETSMWTK